MPVRKKSRKACLEGQIPFVISAKIVTTFGRPVKTNLVKNVLRSNGKYVIIKLKINRSSEHGSLIFEKSVFERRCRTNTYRCKYFKPVMRGLRYWYLREAETGKQAASRAARLPVVEHRRRKTGRAECPKAQGNAGLK